MTPCKGEGCHAQQMHPTGLCARCRAKTAPKRGERWCPMCSRSLTPDKFDEVHKNCVTCLARQRAWVKAHRRAA